jgi:outer membrane murein-binding lipoprotein Lpp
LQPDHHWERWLLYTLLANQEKTMSALTDLQAAVEQLSTDVNAFVTANSGGANDAQLEALTAQVQAIDAVVNPPAPAAPPPAAPPAT